MRQVSQSARAGFTLVELLVVVAIGSLLMVAGANQFLGAQDRARNSQVGSNVWTIQMALEKYADDNGGNYPPSLFDPGFLGAGYLSGNHLPVAPWCSKPQPADCPSFPNNVGVPGTAWTQYIVAAQKGGDVTVLGWPTPGNMADPPVDHLDYGAVRYQYNNGTIDGNYYMFANGKKGSSRLIISPVSNSIF